MCFLSFNFFLKKKVKFNLNNNTTIIYNRYLEKNNYYTECNMLLFFLYSNLNNWNMFLPIPCKNKYYIKLSFENNLFLIRYHIDRFNKIYLIITNNIQSCDNLIVYLNNTMINKNNNSLIIIKHIRDICFNNNIY